MSLTRDIQKKITLAIYDHQCMCKKNGADVAFPQGCGKDPGWIWEKLLWKKLS